MSELMQAQTVALTAPSYRRWLPLLVLAVVVVAIYALGLQNYLSLQSMAEHQASLEAFVAAHWLVALGLYGLIYVTVVALSLPGATALSICGGFIFGWLASGIVTVLAATLGGCINFKVIQSSIGAALRDRAGPWVQRLEAGFEKDAFSYLLFLRLVPAFPFFAVNAVAGLTRMDIKTFALGTFIGIIPGSFAIAWLGRGLGSVLDAARAGHDACVAANGAGACHYDFVLSALITPQLVAALAALGVLALVPVAIKKWQGTDGV